MTSHDEKTANTLRVMELVADVDVRFTYHPPRPDQVPRFEEIRSDARRFALLLVTTCPDSRELALALTHLEQAVMYANAAIARREWNVASADEQD